MKPPPIFYGIRRLIPALLLLLLCHAAFGKDPVYVYDYNDNCSKAYQCYMSMHFTEAGLLVSNELKANPANLMATYLQDYEDCITLLLNCDKEEYAKRKTHFDERLQLLEKGDGAGPWYRLCKAGLYMHWALANVQFGDQLKAAYKFRKSFLLLKENERLFPGFEYNHVFAGLQEAVVGALPGNYQWLATIFGLSGNIKNGTAQLASFINSHTSAQPLYTEAIIYNSYLRFYLAGGQKEVWDYINSPRFPTKDNLLNAFVKANISLDYHKADVTIETLKAAETDPDFDSYPLLSYMEGVALLTKPDMGCIAYFKQYLKNNKNELYVKNSWQRMSFAWYISGNMQQATYCKTQAGTQGNTKLDADKQAEKFAESTEWPQKNLLRARLLTDGGYYTEAFKVLGTIEKTSLTNPADLAEYYYRLGRVYQELTDNNHALEYYKYAITTGEKRHEQFAARAALQMGVIYEHTGQPAQAVASYKACLDMPSHDFQNSIGQQAKAGINRVEGE